MRPFPRVELLFFLVIVLGIPVLIRLGRLRASAAGARAKPAGGSVAGAPGAYSSDSPALEVSSVPRILLHDARRNKELPVRVSYPSGSGPFPVIVFSHGASASGATYLDLTRFWTAAGYVVLQPSHADSIALRRQQGEKIGYARGLSEALEDATENPSAAADRARDVSLVLDSLDEVERLVPAVQGKLDRARIGVGGHSFGAMTAMLSGGAVVYVSGAAPASYGDPRVRAIEVLSGQGETPKMGLTSHSWEKMHLPMLDMTGSRDLGASRQPPGWRKTPFDLSPPGDKYYVFIEGATHFSFVGGKLPILLSARVGGAGQPAIFRWIQMTTLAFWDAYLKDDSRAKAWLDSEDLPRLSHNGATLLRR